MPHVQQNRKPELPSKMLKEGIESERIWHSVMDVLCNNGGPTMGLCPTQGFREHTIHPGHQEYTSEGSPRSQRS